MQRLGGGADETTKIQAQETYGKLPLYFISNDGQVDPKVKFYEKGSGHATFFTKEGVYLNLVKRQKPEIENVKTAVSNPKVPINNLQSEMIKLLPLHANKNPKIIAEGLQEGKVNYFIGNDPKKWKTNIPTYQAVVYQEIYPGIDMKFYGNNRQMEYDIIVKPGTDPSQVQMTYEGIEGLRITEDGNLEISLKEGQIIQKKPIIYQEIGGKRIDLAGRFKIKNQSYSFEVASYDKRFSLIIDPSLLIYSTYLGSNDYGNGIAVDSSGNAYVTGYTSSTDFPITTGAYDTTFNGVSDVFVAKLNPTGSALAYATYLGGSSDDSSRSIAVDGSGNAYVTGWTSSFDFPTTPGAYDTTYNGGTYDVFVAKLDTTGSALSYATYLGGSDAEFGYGIAVDSSGNAYVTGNTRSTDFPITPSAYSTTLNGVSDVFVAKLDVTGLALSYSTYLGGSSNDGGRGIAVDSSGNAYITGWTDSMDFPATPGAYDTTFNGGTYDLFMAKLDVTGSVFSYATYIGGSNYDWVNGIAVDLSGNAYVTGETYSSDFPTTPGAYGTTYSSCFGISNVFVVKLNATGSALSYATYLGACYDDLGKGIAVDSSGNAYVTGFTDSPGFPTTPGAYDTTFNYVGVYLWDVFVAKLNPTGSALSYSTFLGGIQNDLGFGIAVDGSGNAYITGYITDYPLSSDFPTTPGAYDTTFNGSPGVFVAKLVTVITDLSITKTDSLDPVAAGSSLTYTIAVTNNGPDTATGVTMTDALPSGVTFGSATPTQGSCSGTSTVICSLGTLANTASATVTITVTVPTTTGTISNTAVVSGNETDPNPANNSATATTVVGLPDLVETAVSNPPATAKLGGHFSVTDTAANIGTAPAGSSTTRYYLSLNTVRDNPDKRLGGNRSVPALGVGATSTGTVNVTVPTNTVLGTYYLLACADDIKVVNEGTNENNNCKSSMTTVTVTP